MEPPRRFIAKEKRLARGNSKPRFLANKLEWDREAPRVEAGHYCGTLDDRFKEQQFGLSADRTSSHGIMASSFRVLLTA